ncbi:MAG TPA: BON domain-containing protein [Stellaceae bacterium]|nr:BON domain-containing protein [Stellaceae bacterium]
MPKLTRRGPSTPDPIEPVARARPVNEYEERYPEAYGHGEDVPPAEVQRHYSARELPRQVRDEQSPIADARGETPPVVNIQEPDEARAARPRPPQPRHVERPRRPLVERSPGEIADDVAEQLNASSFIDASDISVSVDSSEVTLAGTVASLIQVSLARALAENVPGVSRVQTQLRVQPRPHDYEASSGPVYKVEN